MAKYIIQSGHLSFFCPSQKERQTERCNEEEGEQIKVWRADSHLCEAEEESDAPEDLQSLCCMIQHHIPAGVTETFLFA